MLPSMLKRATRPVVQRATARTFGNLVSDFAKDMAAHRQANPELYKSKSLADLASERAAALNEFKRVEENGTKLNSSSYANYTQAEKWTNEDTEFFFQALKQFGTDFSLIQRLFPGRTRRQIKKKYLIEDRMNPKRVESAINHLSPQPDMYHRLIDVLIAPKTRNVQKGLARSILEPRNLESSCEGIVDNQ